MKGTSLAFAWIGAVGLFLLFPGCESDGPGPGASFTINPTSVTLGQVAKTVTLQANGGSAPYGWSASDATLGTVSGSGAMVTYTRTAANGANTITVSDGGGWTATSTIRQQDDPVEAAALTLTPSSATLDAEDDQVVFTAQGGAGIYRWSLGDADEGEIRSLNELQAVYTRRKGGDNTVVVTDKDGAVAVASVTQPASASLAVSPSATTLGEDDAQVVLTASGGEPGYTWTVGNGTLGTLSAATGVQVVYTRTAQGNNTVQVTDSARNAAVATITQPGGTPLTVSPTVANVAATNGMQVFTAAGGTPPYTWAVVTASGANGQVAPLTGNTTAYTSFNRTNDVVRLQDAVPNTILITITKH